MSIEDVRKNEQFETQSAPSNNQQAAFKKGKMLLVLPLLMIPFLTLAFWALGGGKGDHSVRNVSNTKEGLNLDLPAANLKDDSKEDKLTFYEKAQQEEAKNKDALQNDSLFILRGSVNDPNKLDDIVANSPSQYDPTPKNPYTGLNTSPVHSEKYKDPTEDKIMERLQQLQQEINKPKTNSQNNDVVLNNDSDNSDSGNDADRLEGMMKMLQDKNANDPEMNKLEGMLDKILDIQHPDRVKDRLKEKSIQQKQTVFPISTASGNINVSLLSADTNIKSKSVRNGFYGLNDKRGNEDVQNAVEAVVHETQVLVNGSVIKMRLANDIYINGTLIPKDNFLFGVASLNGERLEIEISAIRFNNSIFPVKLSVYDMDGIAGINIPGAITRDVAKQSADASMQGLELSTLNPSIGAQVATAGINAAKSLVGRKVKLVKVMVKAGYKVLLRSTDAN